jgi:hypothetical protein
MYRNVVVQRGSSAQVQPVQPESVAIPDIDLQVPRKAVNEARHRLFTLGSPPSPPALSRGADARRWAGAKTLRAIIIAETAWSEGVAGPYSNTINSAIFEALYEYDYGAALWIVPRPPTECRNRPTASRGRSK